MPKLPKNLPPLPPVPEGYSRWEYKGIGWTNGGKSCLYACCAREWDSWEVAPTISLRPSGTTYLHYIGAVRDPRPAVIRKSRNTAAPKKREGRVVANRMHIRTDHGESVLCFCLPADAASVERMIEQDARAMMKLLGSWEDTTESHRNQIRALARAALASKGIKAKGGRHG